MKPFPFIDNNVELFLAGGAVRDHVLGLEPKDRDFVAITPYSFDELVMALTVNGFTVFVEKPEYLTIRCMTPDKEAIDIVFPRGEGAYSDGRHPDSVRRVETLEEDSDRRDLAFNAMYMDEKGSIIDYHHGRRDLTARIVCAVGDPYERMREDWVRMLRVIRFACRFDFGIEAMLSQEVYRNMGKLAKCKPDRVREELEKSFACNPARTMAFLLQYKAVASIEELGVHFTVSQADRKR